MGRLWCALELRNLLIFWLRGKDLNLRPLGYEPNELPDCSTPQSHGSVAISKGQTFDDEFFESDSTRSAARPRH
jgi:hypothetical protein